jgi:hypothetical protein
MKLHLEFQKQIDNPLCAIGINGTELYRGGVNNTYDFNIDINEGSVQLVIEHWGKRPKDTVVENNIIVRDRSFELKRIVIDAYDLEELVWHSEFQAVDGNVYPSCLFFGPNGSYILNFHNPVLFWILKTRHETNYNDPHWEEDYKYYINACKILTQISTK